MDGSADTIGIALLQCGPVLCPVVPMSRTIGVLSAYMIHWINVNISTPDDEMFCTSSTAHSFTIDYATASKSSSHGSILLHEIQFCIRALIPHRSELQLHRFVNLPLVLREVELYHGSFLQNFPCVVGEASRCTADKDISVCQRFHRWSEPNHGAMFSFHGLLRIHHIVLPRWRSSNVCNRETAR